MYKYKDDSKKYYLYSKWHKKYISQGWCEPITDDIHKDIPLEYIPTLATVDF
jgi:hypothetical protein